MSDQILWFAARGAGAVSLLLLTTSVCLGLVTVTRFQHVAWPRFFNYEMHRRISLLSIVFLAIHVLAAVLDPYTSLGLAAALIPMASLYRPVPVAIGVVALYLFVALIVTSVARKHVGQRAWRAIHWTSYAFWPLALEHGVSAGTDAFTPWMLAIDLVCVVAVAACLVWRAQPGAGEVNRAGALARSSSSGSTRVTGASS